jgi:hypothetical protein
MKKRKPSESHGSGHRKTKRVSSSSPASAPQSEDPAASSYEADGRVAKEPKVIVVLERACLETGKVGSDHVLLNSDDHHNFLLKHKRDPSEYRPDILHQSMLMLLDSPLNKAGLLKLFVRSERGVLIEVSPQIRIPRTFKRFCGLMTQCVAGLVLRPCLRRPIAQYRHTEPFALGWEARPRCGHGRCQLAAADGPILLRPAGCSSSCPSAPPTGRTSFSRWSRIPSPTTCPQTAASSLSPTRAGWSLSQSAPCTSARPGWSHSRSLAGPALSPWPRCRCPSKPSPVHARPQSNGANHSRPVAPLIQVPHGP